MALAVIGLTSVSYGADPAPKPYALTTCFISGEKLGEMGKPVVFTYEGQEIKLCCKDCKKKFDKDPAGYIKKYDAAVMAKPAVSQASGSMKGCGMPGM